MSLKIDFSAKTIAMKAYLYLFLCLFSTQVCAFGTHPVSDQAMKPEGFVRLNGNCIFVSFPLNKLDSLMLADHYYDIHYYKDIPGDTYYPGMLNYIGGHSINLGTMEYKYCERMFPKNVDQAMSPGFDIPASELAIAPESIAISQKNLLNGPDSTLSYAENTPHDYDAQSPDQGSTAKSAALQSADWQSLLSMNEDAARIWQELLSCQKDPEQAREAYRRGKNFCEEETKNNEIKNSLQALHGNLNAFLLSSRLKNLNGVTLLSEYHPLFIQIVLEFLVKYEAVDGLDEPLPPQVAPEMSYLTGINSLFFPTSPEMAKPEYAFTDAARVVSNSLMLLETAPQERCSAWGFWPGATRLLINNFDLSIGAQGKPESYEFLARGMDQTGTGHDPVKRVAMEKIASACGDIHNTLYNIYGMGDEFLIDHYYQDYYNREFVKAFRAVSKNYEQ